MKLREALILALVIAVTILLSAMFQEPLTRSGGFGWDGVEYGRVAEQCQKRSPVSAMAPFCYRVAGPCLVGLIWGKSLTGFLVLNVIAGTASAFLFLNWISGFIANGLVRVVTAAVYATLWMGPIRFPFWAPAETVDPLFMFMLLLALNMLAWKRAPTWALGAVILAGVLVRETMLLVPVAMCSAAFLDKDWPGLRRACVLVMVGLAGVVVLRFLIQPTDSRFGFLGTALHWAYAKPAPRWLHAMFIVFGPSLALLALAPARTRDFLVQNRTVASILGFVLVLAWIGGSDTERFFVWGAPVVLLLVGRSLETVTLRPRVVAGLSLVAAGQVFAERLFLTIPDWQEVAPRAWPILTPLTAERSTLLVAATPDVKMGALSLLQHLLLCAGVVFLLRETSNPNSERGTGSSVVASVVPENRDREVARAAVASTSSSSLGLTHWLRCAATVSSTDARVRVSLPGTAHLGGPARRPKEVRR